MEYGREMSTGLQIAELVHDLRTPMCAAAGAAQMALEAGGRDVSAQLQQILQAVGAMDRMLSMISGERAESGIFTGKMLHSELLAVMMGRAQAKGQDLSIDLSALDGMTLEADYAALCRLLINLLSNAIKYTPSGGKITLRTQVMRSRWQKDRGQIRFVVADNGPGISQTFMRRMYTPYARSEETSDLPGSGLGLSITRKMVNRLKGTIHAYSRRGRGTAFVVNVPVTISRQAAG